VSHILHIPLIIVDGVATLLLARSSTWFSDMVDASSDTNTPVHLSILTLPTEIRCKIYKFLLGDLIRVIVKVATFKEPVRALRCGDVGDGRASTLSACIEFSPVFYGGTHIKLAFGDVFGPYAGLSYFITLTTSSLKSNLKHLTCHFHIMWDFTEKDDEAALLKALSNFPNLETLTLNASGRCIRAFPDLVLASSATTRWMPSTLRGLQAIMRTLPQLKKAFFNNRAQHSPETWYRHLIRLTTSTGTVEDLVSLSIRKHSHSDAPQEDEVEVDAEYDKWLVAKKRFGQEEGSRNH
jgi:hypothetical protein